MAPSKTEGAASETSVSAAGAEEDARPEVQVRSSGTSFVKSGVAHTGFVNTSGC
jgi:hypothetical protein